MDALTQGAADAFDNSSPAAQNARLGQRVKDIENGVDGGIVLSVAGRTGAVTIASADITDAASAATASKIVKRDASGDAAFHAITTSTTVTATGAVAGASVAATGAVTGASAAITGLAQVGTLAVTEGANKSMGVATLAAGTVTVSTTAIATGDRVVLIHQTQGAAPGFLSLGTIVNATSFVITSSSGTDDSSVLWIIVRPGV